jgi:hypothetical protein
MYPTARTRSGSFLLFLFFLAFSAHAQPAEPSWRKLKTDPYPGKQDDIAFVNERLG